MNSLKFWNYILLVLALVAILIGFFTSAAYADYAGYVSASEANFREAPNGTVITTFQYGQEITVISVDGDWACCVVAGVTGYIWAEYVSPLEAASSTPTPDPATTPTGSYYIEPTATPEPTAEVTPEPTVEPTATPETTIAPTATPEPTATPTPTLAPTVEPETTSTPQASTEPTSTPVPASTVDDALFTEYAEQNLTSLASIQGFLVFFTVVILCYFAYKFLRMFF